MTVEIRSVNHRYTDVRLAAPPEVSSVSTDVERAVKKRFARGRFDVQVSLGPGRFGASTPRVDLDLARAYHRAHAEIARAIGHDGPPPLRAVLEAPGVVTPPETGESAEALGAAVIGALERAMEELAGMRSTEGAMLVGSLEEHLGAISQLTAGIRTRLPTVVRERRRRLEERLAELLVEVEVEPARIAQEVALLADRMDVSEELERLEAHVAHALGVLEKGEPAGRKLDFLVQEMNREANTIGSKSADAQVARMVVDLKAELERVREQVQNLE